MPDYGHLFDVSKLRGGMPPKAASPDTLAQLERANLERLKEAEDVLRCAGTDFFQGIRQRLTETTGRLLDEMKDADAFTLGRVKALRELSQSLDADVESARRLLDGREG